MIVNAAIPLLASLLGGLFTSVFTFFAKYLTKRLAIVAAVVTAIFALTATFFVAIEALIDGVLVASPTFGPLVGHIVPSNASACVSAILAGHVLHWVYSWKTKILQLRLF